MRIIRNEDDNHLFDLYLGLMGVVRVLMMRPFIISIALLTPRPQASGEPALNLSHLFDTCLLPLPDAFVII